MAFSPDGSTLAVGDAQLLVDEGIPLWTLGSELRFRSLGGKNLNASASASFTNVAYYDASKNPGSVPGDRFYTGLLEAFRRWMKP